MRNDVEDTMVPAAHPASLASLRLHSSSSDGAGALPTTAVPASHPPCSRGRMSPAKPVRKQRDFTPAAPPAWQEEGRKR